MGIPYLKEKKNEENEALRCQSFLSPVQPGATAPHAAWSQWQKLFVEF